MCGNGCALEATESNSSPTSPPPFMAGAVEIELDKETGHVEILDYKAVVDCGTVVNPNLARVQTEGGLVQGIGMTLYENIQYNDKGTMLNNSSCSTRSRPEEIWETSRWNLKAVLSRRDRSEQNPSEKS